MLQFNMQLSGIINQQRKAAESVVGSHTSTVCCRTPARQELTTPHPHYSDAQGFLYPRDVCVVSHTSAFPLGDGPLS